MLHRAVTLVLRKLSCKLDICEDVWRAVVQLTPGEISCFIDTDYFYLCNRFKADDAPAMSVVMEELARKR